MNHFTDGYVIAEYVQTPCSGLNYETVSQIKTLYDRLDVTLDPSLSKLVLRWPYARYLRR